MPIGTKNTKSIGKAEPENTPIITHTCMPSEYDLYIHGANDSRANDRKKNIPVANIAYTKQRSKSKRNKTTAPESPRRYRNMGSPFCRIYALLSSKLTPIAIPITKNTIQQSAYTITVERLRLIAWVNL